MIYFFEHNMKSRILVFLMFALSSLSQLCGQDRFTLTGRVTDENGDPVELATVHIEKQLIGAMTDFNGKYRISAVSSDSVVVVFSIHPQKDIEVSCGRFDSQCGIAQYRL